MCGQLKALENSQISGSSLYQVFFSVCAVVMSYGTGRFGSVPEISFPLSLPPPPPSMKRAIVRLFPDGVGLACFLVCVCLELMFWFIEGCIFKGFSGGFQDLEGQTKNWYGRSFK